MTAEKFIVPTGQSYAQQTLSVPYPIQLTSLGNQQLIEWQSQAGFNPVNKSFLEDLKKNQPGVGRLFSEFSLTRAKDGHLQPALFIFHISRCGSTLAANYFATDPENRVFNEPEILSLSFRSGRTTQPESENIADWQKTIYALTEGALKAQKRLIIKFSANHLRHITEIHQAFPEVPKWLIVRQPSEVITSLMQAPPIYLRKKTKNKRKSESLKLTEDHLKETLEVACVNKSIFKHIIDYTELLDNLRLLEEKSWTLDKQTYRQELVNKICLLHSKKGSIFKSDITVKRSLWKSLNEEIGTSIEKHTKLYNQLR